MVTLQVPAPVQTIPQPPKAESGPGVAESTSVAPLARSTSHAVAPRPQSIGPPDTLPVPSPPRPTESRYTLGWKVAVTPRGPVITTLHPLVPGAQPDQPEVMEASPGVAVRSAVAPF